MTNKKERPFRGKQGRRPQEFEPQIYEKVNEVLLKKVNNDDDNQVNK